MFARGVGAVRTGFTLVEMMVALVVFSFFLAGFFAVFEQVVGRGSQKLSERLVLQMEARRALLNIWRIVQEGAEIVSPPPGTTLPYLVFRDQGQNLGCLYLEPDPVNSKATDRPIFRAMLLRRDPGQPVASAPVPVMERVARLNFTAHGPSGVLLSLTLTDGIAEFSLVNFVHLKNSQAED